MKLVELYARSKDEAQFYSDELRRFGENPSITIVDINDETVISMPAIRTQNNMFEGEAAVSRVIAEVEREADKQKDH